MREKKKREDITPIDSLLDYTVDLAKIAWREKQRAIESAAMKPSVRIDLHSGFMRLDMTVLDSYPVESWKDATYMLRSYLITILQEVGMYEEAFALINLERRSASEIPDPPSLHDERAAMLIRQYNELVEEAARFPWQFRAMGERVEDGEEDE